MSQPVCFRELDLESPSLSPVSFLWSATKWSLLAFVYATWRGGRPYDQVGLRPRRGGLGDVWDFFVRGVGVAGYDSVLGSCPSPVVRGVYTVSSWAVAMALGVGFAPHVRQWLAWVWAWVWFRYDSLGGATATGTVTGTCRDGGYVTLLSSALWLWWWLRPNRVSDPGGPRAHKIPRSPHWNDEGWTQSVNVQEGATTTSTSTSTVWRCAVAEESHRLTEAKVASSNKTKSLDAIPHPFLKDVPALKVGLTGEPSGRQTWTTAALAASPTEPNVGNVHVPPVEVDEALVQELSRGGRPAGFNPAVNPNSCDQIYRAERIRTYLSRGGVAPSTDAPSTPSEAAERAAQFYAMLQSDDGHWAGDYGGPHFLLPGMVVAWYVMGQPSQMLDPPRCAAIRSYLENHQQSDGGWGTHVESPSTMFGTVLSYTALRLLGRTADHPTCQRGRTFILANGGALYTGSWAKFWLCLLGAMDWRGHNSVPPELFVWLPRNTPFHPGRLWCHCRMVYLPMSYVYGTRMVYANAETDPVVQALRSELYLYPHPPTTQINERRNNHCAYASIPWSSTRHWVAPMDNYSPIPWAMRFLQNLLDVYEHNDTVFGWIRRRVRQDGLRFALQYMSAEDLQTNFIDIGPVNKAINMVSMYHALNGDLSHPILQNHMMRVDDYLWVAEDGMKMQGYNGSQCWDTTFAIQAMAESRLLRKLPETTRKVWDYVERTQILSTETSQASPAYAFEAPSAREKYFRHVSKGGWPFSTSAHGWPISDCTGEGLKAALLMRDVIFHKNDNDPNIFRRNHSQPPQPMEPQRFQDAVHVILTLQNEDGGWATYENNRGFGWFESLNPSEVFGDIMIDYSYVECSMASMTALAAFAKAFPDHRSDDIRWALQRGANFVKRIQRPDGSWYGSWACCFTYGCWFGIEGLVAAGEPRSSPAIVKCCRFLLSHQRENGGWGEDFTSCYDKDYAAEGMKSYGDGGSGVVNTAWALMALAEAKCDSMDAIRRGVAYLMKRQRPGGDWPQEGISGVFNRACGITYTSYRNVFPMWALGRCVAVYGDDALSILPKSDQPTD